MPFFKITLIGYFFTLSFLKISMEFEYVFENPKNTLIELILQKISNALKKSFNFVAN